LVCSFPASNFWHANAQCSGWRGEGVILKFEAVTIGREAAGGNGVCKLVDGIAL